MIRVRAGAPPLDAFFPDGVAGELAISAPSGGEPFSIAWREDGPWRFAVPFAVLGWSYEPTRR